MNCRLVCINQIWFFFNVLDAAAIYASQGADLKLFQSNRDCVGLHILFIVLLFHNCPFSQNVKTAFQETVRADVEML